jgi:DNA (cytosine-5)-methyltransferase 1
VQEIAASRFRRTPLFWASPECVNHTSCKGKRDDSPEAQRSRATFKDIVRFTAHHRYDAVIVENVVEARLWCEHENCACGAEFDAWYRAMLDEGYEGQIVYFNSQFALPTPQSRDRMYIVFWRRGLRRPAIEFRPWSWCTSCADVVRGVQTWKPASRGSSREHVFEWGRYGAQYVYRCPNDGCGQPVAPAVVGARSIIDFTIPIERIADKRPSLCKTCGTRHPVACNTRRRIKVGWENIGRRTPMAVQVGGNLYERDGYARVWAIDGPIKTITQTRELALVTPAGSQDAKARAAGEPMHALTGTERLAMVTAAGGPTGAGRNPRSTGEPLGTVTTHDREALVVTDADIDECYLRMLQWQELLRAQVMHQHGDGRAYELTARRRDKRGRLVELSNALRTKMIGNAVSTPVATMLGHAVMEVLR